MNCTNRGVCFYTSPCTNRSACIIRRHVPTILLCRTSSESSDLDPESDLEKTESKHIVKNIHDQDHDPSAEDELIAR